MIVRITNIAQLSNWLPAHLSGTNCKRVDLLAANEEGITPLHDAALNNRAEVCRLLLQHGGHKLLALKTCRNYTPLDLAETDDTVKVLREFQHTEKKHSDSLRSSSTSEGKFSEHKL